MDRTILFDADEYYRNGKTPWSFLAWPSSIDDEDGLPKNEEALRFLSVMQERGVPLGTWRLPDDAAAPHTWAVVRFEHSPLVFQALASLEEDGVIPAGYTEALADRLMSLA